MVNFIINCPKCGKEIELKPPYVCEKCFEPLKIDNKTKMFVDFFSNLENETMDKEEENVSDNK